MVACLPVALFALAQVPAVTARRGAPTELSPGEHRAIKSEARRTGCAIYRSKLNER